MNVVIVTNQPLFRVNILNKMQSIKISYIISPSKFGIDKIIILFIIFIMHNSDLLKNGGIKLIN